MMALIVATLLGVEVAVPVVTPVAVEMMMTIMRMMALIVATLLAVEVAVPVVTPVAVEMMMTIMRMMAAAAIAEVDVVILLVQL
jgi:hypothetical protein